VRLVIDSLPKVVRALKAVGVAPVEALKGVWIDVFDSTIFNLDDILPPGLRPAYDKARDALDGRSLDGRSLGGKSLGRRSLEGRSLDGDPLPAELLGPIVDGAGKGDPAMASLLAHLRRRGLGVPEDLDEAYRLTRLAAEAGDLVAASILGDLLMEGKGTLPDYAEALVWLRRALPLGANKTLLGLWRVRLFRPDLISDAEAVESVRIAASRGDAMARSIIDEGLAEQNYTVEECRRMARYGEPMSSVTLGKLLLFGPPESRDEIDGVEALRFAARWQEERAARLLARLYHDGACGLPKDPAKAARWAKAAKRFERDLVKRGPREDVVRYRSPEGWKTLDMNSGRAGRAGQRKKPVKPSKEGKPPPGE
jgi:TPR repeat protein